MSISDRQKQFEAAIKELPGVKATARIARNFGFSNSARVIEGGLFAGTNNLETYSRKLAEKTEEPLEQFIFLCVLTFPPQDEVYFAIFIESTAGKFNDVLKKLYHQGVERNEQLKAEGKSASSISNNVKFYLAGDRNIFIHNYDFVESLTDAVPDQDWLIPIDAIQFSIYPPAASARRPFFLVALTGISRRRRTVSSPPRIRLPRSAT